MCVEDIQLSSYIDGELGGAGLERVRKHLEECPACRERAACLRRLSAGLSGRTLSPIEVAESFDRVAARLDHVISPGSERGFWNRRFSVPAPLAAAAVLALLLLAAFAGSRFIGPGAGAPGQLPLAAGDYSEEFMLLASEPETTSDAAAIQQLFDLLESSGASIEVRIDLPSESSFTVYGEPQLLRAADFRRNDSR